MSSSHHHIRRQRWHLQAPDRAGAFSLRTLLRQELDSLNTLFERSLDAVDKREEMLHIPRLELHLRIRDASELAEQLSLALRTQLPEQLAGRNTAAALSNASSGAAYGRQRLLGFLQRGALSWHEQDNDAPALCRQLAATLEAWLEQQDDVWTALSEIAPSTPEAATAFFLRLLNLLPAPVQARLIRAAQIASTERPAATQAIAERAAIVQLLHKLEALNPGTYPQLYLQALQLAALAAPTPPTAHTLLSQVEQALGQQATRQLLRPALLQAPAWPPRPQAPTPQSAVSGAPRSADATASQSPTEAPDAISLPPVTARLLAPEDEEAPGLRVHMAGLVLLHGYLPRLFEACRIMFDAHGRITPPCLARAAALLHRLATGREEIHEFELDLVKPLLGLGPDSLLPVAQGLLDEADAEECAALIAAVITHWSVLRGTSPDGLRISFLQRQGLLHDDGQHWQLHVESESFDVLLAQLPWGISLIKLPWMTKPIFTDWPTR